MTVPSNASRAPHPRIERDRPERRDPDYDQPWDPQPWDRHDIARALVDWRLWIAGAAMLAGFGAFCVWMFTLVQGPTT